MGSSRPFTTAYGSKINVYGGDYGWKIYFDKEKTKLIKEIKSGKDVEREPTKPNAESQLKMISVTLMSK